MKNNNQISSLSLRIEKLMKKNWYKIFNYGTISLAFIIAVLLALDKIPRQLYIPLLVIMIVIFILRIVIRYYLINISKKQSS